MLANIKIARNSKTQIYLQISKQISKQIDKGVLKKEEALPSINIFSERFAVARDTAERAYKDLKKQGYITGVNGKGYFVVGKKEKKIKILFILNKISSYKRIIYYSFLKTLGNKAVVDLQIHHYNPLVLKDILDTHLGKYSYYVLMPHFELQLKKDSWIKQVKRIPVNELVILDKAIPEMKENISVCQDFRKDIYDALVTAKDLVKKYQGLTLVLSEHSNHPPEIALGLSQFSKENHKSFTVVSDADTLSPEKGMAYIVITDNDLAVLIKKIKKTNYRIGKDIGIISFNETELKDLLDITVISTDFEQMGQTAAELILKNQFKQVRNPFKIIRRGSL